MIHLRLRLSASVMVSPRFSKIRKRKEAATSITTTDECMLNDGIHRQEDPVGSAATANYEDTDAQTTNHDDYNDDGSVAISLSQYSQMNATKDDNSETTSGTAPAGFAVGANTATSSRTVAITVWMSRPLPVLPPEPWVLTPLKAPWQPESHDSSFFILSVNGAHTFGVTSVANSVRTACAHWQLFATA